jgi:anthranilate phosphoribosyltransferase
VKEFIQKVVEHHDLSREEAARAMRCIMEGAATDAQIAGFLVALKLKGEHTDELFGFAEVMREKCLKIRVDDPHAVDLCGTGGDGTGTFNISTVAAFVVAGVGVTVAKHGNRSVSSSCGSADVLRALGVGIDCTPAQVEHCINTVGIGFLFAPLFHPSMKHAARPRAELGFRTCFNLLGPLTNPGAIRRQLAGTFSKLAAEKMASVFRSLGSERVFVVSGSDGLDEVSLESSTIVFEVHNQQPIRRTEFEPHTSSLAKVKRQDILGGTVEQNASIALDVLRGVYGPHRDVVLVNAAFALLAAGRATSVEEGIALAAESIDSGTALTKLNQLREATSA